MSEKIGLDKWGLDKYSLWILLVMVAHDRPVQYNELERMFEKPPKGQEDFKFMHHPDFVKGLRRLVDLGYVSKKPKVRQRGHPTIYSLYDKLGKVKGDLGSRVEISKLFEKDEKLFFSLSIGEQVAEVLRILCLRKLYGFRSRVAFERDPYSFENWFGVYAWSFPLEHHEAWLVQKCIDDAEYGKEVSKAVDELILRLKKLNLVFARASIFALMEKDKC